MFSGGVVDRPIWVPLLSTFLQTSSTWQMHPTMSIPSMCMGNLWNSLLCIASCLKHQHNFVRWVFVVLVLACLGKKKSWYCALISMIIITSSQKTKYSWQGEFGLHWDLSLVTQFWSQTAQCDWVGATGWTHFSRVTRIIVRCSCCQLTGREGQMKSNMLSAQAVSFPTLITWWPYSVLFAMLLLWIA